MTTSIETWLSNLKRLAQLEDELQNYQLAYHEQVISLKGDIHAIWQGVLADDEIVTTLTQSISELEELSAYPHPAQLEQDVHQQQIRLSQLQASSNQAETTIQALLSFIDGLSEAKHVLSQHATICSQAEQRMAEWTDIQMLKERLVANETRVSQLKQIELLQADIIWLNEAVTDQDKVVNKLIGDMNAIFAHYTPDHKLVALDGDTQPILLRQIMLNINILHRIDGITQQTLNTHQEELAHLNDVHANLQYQLQNYQERLKRAKDLEADSEWFVELSKYDVEVNINLDPYQVYEQLRQKWDFLQKIKHLFEKEDAEMKQRQIQL